MNRRNVLKPAVLAAVATQVTGSGARAEPAASGQVAFTVELRVRPGLEAEFLSLLRPVLDAMRHESTFINAVLHRDPEDPAHFLIYETWADLQDVVDVQLGRDYRREYMRRLPDILAAERGISVWTPMRSDFAPRSGA